MNESLALLMAALAAVSSTPTAVTMPADSTSSLQQAVERTVPGQRELSAYQPFMTLPFQREDSADRTAPNEGWYYSPQEMRIHGKASHRGLDWPVRRGTPVLAVADGYAVRSFQLAQTGRSFEGKTVGFSLGEFVEVWHPEQKLYSLYGHLQKADDAVAFVKTTRLSAETWEPEGIYVTDEQFMQRATPIKRGQVIGYAGDSGIGWGYSDSFDTAKQHVRERDHDALPSWDETHIHLEVYTRTDDGRRKQLRLDPYGLYDYITPDRNHYRAPQLPESTLWLTGGTGRPLHADEL